MLRCICIVKDFLNKNLIVKALRPIFNKWDLVKLKWCCVVNGPTIWMKGQSTER